MPEILTSSLRERTLGLILAGGQSRRMGGQDKAFAPLFGEPMVAHVMRRLRPQVGRLVISSNSDPGAFAAFDAPVLRDDLEGFHGPLAGLASAMRYGRRLDPAITHVLSVSTDTPFVPRALRAVLADALSERAPAAVAQSGDEVHWVVGLWPIDALDVIETALAQGERAVKRVLQTLMPAIVPFGDVNIGGRPFDPFFNVNTHEDLSIAEAMLLQRGTPLFGVAGWKGAGKTTLTCRLIELFSALGLKVGTIKHSHHATPSPGVETDTSRHRARGAHRVALVTPEAWGLEPHIIHEPEPPLATVVEALGDVDLVIVEGMKGAPIPKIEVRNGPPTEARPQLTESVIAIACDEDVPGAQVPVFRRDDAAGLARFLMCEFGI